MFYAERIEDCKIIERGVFVSVEEFIPYREKGWSGTKEIDKVADEIIKFKDTPDYILEYFSSMSCGEKERKELCRRKVIENEKNK